MHITVIDVEITGVVATSHGVIEIAPVRVRPLNGTPHFCALSTLAKVWNLRMKCSPSLPCLGFKAPMPGHPGRGLRNRFQQVRARACIKQVFDAHSYRG